MSTETQTPVDGTQFMTFHDFAYDAGKTGPERKAEVIGSVGDGKELERFIRNGDWNEYHLIARGHTLIHVLNGHVMSIVVDEDPAHRRSDGLLGVHVVGRGDVDDINVIALKQLAPVGLDGLVAPLVGEGLHRRRIAAADGLWDEFVGGGEEVVDLVEGVAVGAAHEAVADESDAELFLGHVTCALC